MNSPALLASNQSASANHSIILSGRPSDRSAALPPYGGREAAHATQATPMRVLDGGLCEVHLTDYRRLSPSTAMWRASRTTLTYPVLDQATTAPGDPWDELDRLGKLVADAWKSEKSGVELLLEERR